MKVLTSNGFKDFDGIKITTGHNKLLKIITSNNKYLECTFNHLLRVKDGRFLRADELHIGDELFSNEVITEIIEIDNTEPVYDLLNVADGNHYLTNGIISHNCVFIDECAFVPRNIWNDFWRSTYPTISSGKETKCIIVSTPNGQNQFYDIWSSAEEGRSSFKPIRVDWWDVPGRDSEWERVTRSNMSEEEFAVEYGNSFLGSSYTLIRGDYITKIGRDLKTPIQFSQTLRVYEEPELLNKYFITVDCADTGKDYSVISVFDITKFPYKHVAVFRDRISHLALPEIIQRIGQKYNSAPVLIENNDVGKAIINILNYTLEYPDVISTKIGTRYELGIRTTKKTKALGCKSLKDFIESGNLTINDKWTYEEIKHFVLNGMSYEAEEGYHDDIVMTLVTFSYFATTPTFKMHYDVSFADEYREKFKEELEERVLLPLPMFSDGRNDTPFFFKMNF